MDKSSADASPDANHSSSTAAGDSALLRGVHQASSTLHETIDKVAEPARNGVDRAATAAHHTVDQLAQGASSVADKVTDRAQRLGDAPLRALDCSKTYIQDHPLQSVGAALLLGLVVGRLSASRY
jgi:ElaB/YqjD/DUF883 family membrane-anchored ribosome-binding protein